MKGHSNNKISGPLREEQKGTIRGFNFFPLRRLMIGDILCLLLILLLLEVILCKKRTTGESISIGSTCRYTVGRARFIGSALGIESCYSLFVYFFRASSMGMRMGIRGPLVRVGEVFSTSTILGLRSPLTRIGEVSSASTILGLRSIPAIAAKVVPGTGALERRSEIDKDNCL